VSAKKRTSDIESISYRYSLYETSSKSLIWEAESSRLAGFFGGMPDSEKTIAELEKYLKEAKLIQ
jgi:spore coat protein U-like protein